MDAADKEDGNGECEEEMEEEEEEGWWEGEEAKTLEEEARDRNITNLFDPELLGRHSFGSPLTIVSIS